MLSVVVPILPIPQGGRHVNVTYIGDLLDTEHEVNGKVYTLGMDKVVLDEFSYDGVGFPVYINIATEGRNLKGYENNRIGVPYPSGADGEHIKKYDGDGQLVINMKQVGVKVRNIKWLSIWCSIYQLSLGHVEF